MLVRVRASTRASRNRIAGERAGQLLIQTTAPPIEGRANDAICRLLAKALGIARGRLEIAAGELHRDKVIRIDGLTVDEVSKRLDLTP